MSTHSKVESQVLTKETRDLMNVYESLDTDGKLAFLYFVYKDMGESVTPAAPAAAEPELAPQLLGDFYNLSHEQQLDVMREIVNGDDTPYSHAYGGLSANNQLVVWYAWAKGMGDTVVGMPDNYEMTDAMKRSLSHLEGLGFEHQISALREMASRMGYSDVQAIPTQAETGKTASL